jgi:hypothetical protein
MSLIECATKQIVVKTQQKYNLRFVQANGRSRPPLLQAKVRDILVKCKAGIEQCTVSSNLLATIIVTARGQISI